MKTLIALCFTLALTACGMDDSSVDKTVTGTNTATGNGVTIDRTKPIANSLPIPEGFVQLQESLETCLFSTSMACETRFTAPIDCASATVTLRLVDNGTLYEVSTETVLVNGEYLIVRFPGPVKGSRSIYDTQSQTIVRCAE